MSLTEIERIKEKFKRYFQYQVHPAADVGWVLLADNPDELFEAIEQYVIKALEKQRVALKRIYTDFNVHKETHRKDVIKARIEERETFIKCDTLGENTRRAIKTSIAELKKGLNEKQIPNI